MDVIPKFLPLLIGLLSGAPDLEKFVSYLIAVTTAEARNDAADRLVAMHFKNGVAHLSNYEVETDVNKKKQHAELARRDFISAVNVEVDLIRVGRAQLYVSSSSLMLGDSQLTLHWAEQSYTTFSDAEAISWRVSAFTAKAAIAITRSLMVDYYTLPCHFGIAKEIEILTRMYDRESRPRPLFGSPAPEYRQSLLREIYSYKVPLAKFLRERGSKLKELQYPDTISFTDHAAGAAAAARISQRVCYQKWWPDWIPAWAE